MFNEQHGQNYHNPGAILAILSALLFGASPSFCKLTFGEMSPLLLAGLLYLGSGVSLAIFSILRRQGHFHQVRHLRSTQKLALMGSILCGGILAPVFLAYAIKFASAFEVSLLLNLETVSTTILASLLFQEHVGLRVWISKSFVLVGAALLSFVPGTEITFAMPSILVLTACLLWGLDNNLTRQIEDLSPSVLAAVKGLSAGVFNTVLALGLGTGQVSSIQVGGTLFVGAISFGISLVFFISALRRIGASRTSTYFAMGPFLGSFVAIFLLGEKPSLFHWVVALIMALGIFLLFWEHHSHRHTHENTTHRHRHTHDEHHKHQHEGTEGKEPHDHTHTHEPITHSHPHYPDIHHRHSH